MKNSQTFLSLSKKFGKSVAFQTTKSRVGAPAFDNSNPSYYIDFSNDVIVTHYYIEENEHMKDMINHMHSIKSGCTEHIHQKIVLGFKNSGNGNFANIKFDKKLGEYVGCSSLDSDPSMVTVFPEHSLIEPSKFHKKTFYDCEIVIMRDKKSKHILDVYISTYRKKKFAVDVKYHDGKIIVNVNGKHIYFDPSNGGSENSSTFEGLIRAICIQPNNFNKKKIIDKAYYIYKTQFS